MDGKRGAMSHIAIFYITNASSDQAEQLAYLLLEQRLIACANLLDGDSIYRDKEAISQEKEVVLVAKTAPHCISAVREMVQEQHPYDTPCITSFMAQTNEAYAHYVQQNVVGPEETAV